MLVHDSQKDIKVRRERDGTQIELWLARISGILHAQIVNHREGKPPLLVQFDAFYMCMEAVMELGFSDEEILPYVFAETRSQGPEAYKMPYRLNVQAIIHYDKWPLTIADQMASAAQKMAGYFTGKPVTVKQMGQLKVTEHGEIDTTVEMNDQQWTEPFELADDCLFCMKMTDQSVLDRVAGFQWAMDKEVANRFGAGLSQESNAPKHYQWNDTHAERREYHDLLKPWYVDHPQLLKVVTLIDLPLHLKRTLCIQWNHIVRDRLKAEPRFVYRPEDGMYFWMNVEKSTDETTKRIIPSIETRSNPTGNVEANVNSFNPFYGYYF